MERAVVKVHKLTDGDVERLCCRQDGVLLLEAATKERMQGDRPSSGSYLEEIYIKCEVPESQLEVITVKDEPIDWHQGPQASSSSGSHAVTHKKDVEDDCTEARSRRVEAEDKLRESSSGACNTSAVHQKPAGASQGSADLLPSDVSGSGSGVAAAPPDRLISQPCLNHMYRHFRLGRMAAPMSQTSDLHPATRSVEWTKASTLVFIDAWKTHPSLWQVKHPGYKNRNLRGAAINKIVETMKPHFAGINVESVKSKINTLRTQFRRERKYLKDSLKSGTGSTVVHSPKLWCYDNLLFLKEGEVQCQSKSSLDEPLLQCPSKNVLQEGEAIMEESGIIEVSVSPCSTTTSAISSTSSTSTPVQIPQKKQKLTQSEELMTIAVNKLKNIDSQDDQFAVEGGAVTKEVGKMDDNKKQKLPQREELMSIAINKLNNIDSENDQFAVHKGVVTKELGKMDNMNQTIAWKLISDAIFLGSLGVLKPTAVINND